MQLRTSTPRLVRTSQAIAAAGRSSSQSDTTSMRRHRLPDGQNILSGILVPIVDGAALASPSSDAQRHLRLQYPADRAHFTRREPSVDLDRSLPVHRCLRFDRTNRSPDTGVTERAGKGVVFDHASQVQVLQVDHIEATDEVPRQLVDGVSTTICDALLGSRQAAGRQMSPLTPLAFTGDGSLKLGDPRLLLLPMLRVWNPLARRERCEPGDSEIDSDFRAGLGELRGRNIDHHRDEVSPRGLADYRHRGGVDAPHRTRPLHTKMSQECQLQVSSARIEGHGAASIDGRLRAGLALEGGVGRPLVEEVHEGSLETPEGLLRRDTRYLVQPSMLWRLLELRQRQARLGEVHAAACSKRLGALHQPEVVDEPHTPKGASKLLSLGLSWVASKCPPELHELPIIRVPGKAQAAEHSIPPRPEGRGLLELFR